MTKNTKTSSQILKHLLIINDAKKNTPQQELSSSSEKTLSSSSEQELSSSSGDDKSYLSFNSDDETSYYTPFASPEIKRRSSWLNLSQSSSPVVQKNLERSSYSDPIKRFSDNAELPIVGSNDDAIVPLLDASHESPTRKFR